MRLLFFIHSLGPGGAERVTATLANHWAGRGWSVTIVTVDDAAPDFYSLVPGVRRRRLGLAGESGGPLQAIGANLRRVWALRRVLRTERPAVAVAMMPSANVLLALATRGLGVAAIGSERIHPPRFPLGRFWATARWFAYGWLDRVVAQTAATRQWLAEHSRAPAERIAVIANPVAWPDGGTHRQEPGGAAAAERRWPRTLLAVGRLVPQKGFDRLIEAFAACAPRHPDWGLVMLGEGPERAALAARVRELGLEDRVELPGAAADIGAWYAASDLFALTSRFEGFPNTLLEAMAHGCAVVAMDCETGPSEIVRDGVDGVLVAEGDHTGLVDALSRLMGDAAYRQRLGEAAVAVCQRFAVERIAGEWEAVFAAVKPTGGATERTLADAAEREGDP